MCRSRDKEEVKNSRMVFVAFLAGMALGAFAPRPAEAAKNCSLDGTAGLNPVYGQTIVDSGSVAPGDTIASMGESNTKQIFATIRRSDVNLVNSATGGCTIGNYARNNPSKCWNNMPKSAAIIWIKPINRSLGIDPGVYQAALEQDIVGALGEIEDRITGVKQVWLSGHHATPYAADRVVRGVLKPPKQGEPYSHDSVFPIQNVVAQYQGAYSFRLVNSAYLWANANKQRADGLQWTCDDFVTDGVHLSDAGNAKAGDLVNQFIANALGAAPPPPPPPGDDPPPPEPEQCPVPGWAERKGYTCSWNERQQRCVCRP